MDHLLSKEKDVRNTFPVFISCSVLRDHYDFSVVL